MSPVNQSRRAFFRGRINSKTRVFRPPWAVSDFEERCDQCNACISACEEKIIIKGDGGFPEIDFSKGGCEFCEDCVKTCSVSALDLTRALPWKLKAVIKPGCLSSNAIICRTCAEACGQRAIHFQIQVGGRAVPQVNRALCDGCGFCFSVCPEQAIELEEVS